MENLYSHSVLDMLPNLYYSRARYSPFVIYNKSYFTSFPGHSLHILYRHEIDWQNVSIDSRFYCIALCCRSDYLHDNTASLCDCLTCGDRALVNLVLVVIDLSGLVGIFSTYSTHSLSYRKLGRLFRVPVRMRHS